MQVRILEFLKKYIGYRLVSRFPYVRDYVLPSHRFGIDPIQLACLVRLIENTRTEGGLVCEIGVGVGHTSVFLLEHLRSTGNPAEVILVDTFDGFTEGSIEYEVRNRDKNRSEIDVFKYGSAKLFEANIRRLGYDRFTVIAEDCQVVDGEALGPIAVALLDVDLYVPTKRTLERIWPNIVSGGGCLVDDCREGGPWDGAYQAYSEFVDEHQLPFLPVGRKGGLLVKP